MTNYRRCAERLGRGLASTASIALVVACGTSPLPVATEVTQPEPAEPTPLDATASVTEPATIDAGVSDDVPTETRSGVMTGDEWRDVSGNLVGLESECGNVSFVSAHPGTDQVIAGIALQGLWALSPDEEAWDRLGTAAGSAGIRNRTGWIDYDPEQPDRFWESGAYSIGAFRTDDAGATFTQLGSVEHLDGISVDLTDPARRTLLAGRHEKTELVRSEDGGTTWSAVDSFPVDAGYPSSPFIVDSDTYLVGTQGAAESGVYRSDDGGETWELVQSGNYPYPPTVDGETIYWLSETTIIVSDDGGATFTLTGRAPQGSASMAMVSDDVLVALGGQNLVVSYDRGEAWEQVGPPLPFEPVGLTYSASRGEVYVWRFTCGKSGARNSVPAESIQALDIVDGS